MQCESNLCGKCMGISWLIIGLLLVLNSWLNLVDWWLLIGALIVLKGLMMLIKPMGCGCCTVKMPATASKPMPKKKK